MNSWFPVAWGCSSAHSPWTPIEGMAEPGHSCILSTPAHTHMHDLSTNAGQCHTSPSSLWRPASVYRWPVPEHSKHRLEEFMDSIMCTGDLRNAAEACGGGAGLVSCVYVHARDGSDQQVQKWRQQRVEKQNGLRRQGNSSWVPSEPVLGPRLIYLSWQPFTGTCTIRKHPVREPNWKQSAALRQQNCSGKL